VKRSFREFDLDGNGLLDGDELMAAFTSMVRFRLVWATGRLDPALGKGIEPLGGNVQVTEIQGPTQQGEGAACTHLPGVPEHDVCTRTIEHAWFHGPIRALTWLWAFRGKRKLDLLLCIAG
jgi:hypothetical protein